MSTGTDTDSAADGATRPPRKKKAATPKTTSGKTKKAKKKKSSKKKAPKSVKKEAQSVKSDKRKREIRVYPFPAGTFQDALEFATQIYVHGSGLAIRRLTFFDAIQKSPESGPSRQLIANASKYGLITGNYSSETLDLTADGKTATSDEVPARDRARARVKLAIEQIAPFNSVYQRYVNNKMPSRAVLIDAMKEADVPDELAEQGVDTFTVNAQFVGILKTLSGAERIISVEHLLEEIRDSASPTITESTKSSSGAISKDSTGFDNICFYITTIGDEGTNNRIHADMFLGSIVEPALENSGLEIVRADKIEKPGIITKQIIEYLLKSKLVIADLSFHNPNVFYELAIRHMMRLPTVQITRSEDRIPFDVNQNRTIQIDCSSAYGIAPQLETYRARIAAQTRSALEDADASDNPVALYWPSLKVTL